MPPAFVEQKKPAMKRRESPGSGSGRIPDSRKMMTISPIAPYVSIRYRGSSQFEREHGCER